MGTSICTIPCTPLTIAGCPPGNTCALANDSTNTNEVVTYCTTPGTVAVGGTCSASAGCASGLECIEVATTADGGQIDQCTSECIVGGTNNCEAKQTCQSLGTSGASQYGLCADP